jgi:uncharacterized glyoxalase superfamily protein PhnB
MSQTIFPVVRYRDPDAAITWLGEAFGLTEHAIHRRDGVVRHAELRLGDSLLMLGPTEGPHEARPGTAHLYVVVEDADGHHARAVTAGATIVTELSDQDYGSRDYSARDPEGNLWSFGTYAPEV